MHNLWHLMGFASENEFGYDFDKELDFYRRIAESGPDVFAHILSFWGWHGVSIFIFLSGFGLAKKYERPGVVMGSAGKFIISHFLKLFVLMAPVFSVHIFKSWLGGYYVMAGPTLAQFALLINVVYSSEFIYPGVLWFLGLAFQLYVVYRISICRKSDFWLYLWAVFSLLIMVWALSVVWVRDVYITDYIRHNFLGWIYVFVFGVWCARRPAVKMDSWLLWGLFLVLFMLCGLNVYTWILTPVLAVLLSVRLLRCAMSVPLLKRLGLWLGNISAALFVVHPFVRMYFVSRPFSYWSSILYLLVSCAVAFLYNKLYKLLISKSFTALRI